MLATRIIDSIEELNRFAGHSAAFVIHAHPMIKKQVLREHVDAAIREAGYVGTFEYSQDVGSPEIFQIRPVS